MLAEKIIQGASDDELLARIFAAEGRGHQDVDAVLGSVKEPELRVRDTAKIYFGKIVVAELTDYSPEQRRNWMNG